MIDEKKLIEDLVCCKELGRKSCQAVLDVINAQQKLDVPDTNVGSRREWYQKGYQDGLDADKWIPCSERLPEDDTDVLICIGEFVHEARFYEGHFSNAYGMWYKAVQHWQPLPEPYKGE